MKPTPLSIAALVGIVVTYVRAIYFTPYEAKEFGLVDEVLTKLPSEAKK